MSEPKAETSSESLDSLRKAAVNQFPRLVQKVPLHRLSQSEKGDFVLPLEEWRGAGYQVFLSGDRCGQSVRMSDGVCFSDPLDLFRDIDRIREGYGSAVAFLRSELRPESPEDIKRYSLDHLPKVCAALLPAGWREIERIDGKPDEGFWCAFHDDSVRQFRICVSGGVDGSWRVMQGGGAISGSDDFLYLVGMVRKCSKDEALQWLSGLFRFDGCFCGLYPNGLGESVDLIRSDLEMWSEIDFLPLSDEANDSLCRAKVAQPLKRQRQIKGWRKPDPENKGHYLFYYTPTAFRELAKGAKARDDLSFALRYLGVLRCNESGGMWREPLPNGCPVSYCVIGANLWA